LFGGSPTGASGWDRSWADGGGTVVANLHTVCRAHHRFKHLYNLNYEATLDGILWHLPNGRRYLKQHQPTRTRHHQHQPPFPPVIIDLTGYTHSGPPPHLRQ
jgi:hypothetical protein